MINMYEEGHKVKSARKLPATLLDALRLLEKNRVLRAGLGDEFVDSLHQIKNAGVGGVHFTPQ